MPRARTGRGGVGLLSRRSFFCFCLEGRIHSCVCARCSGEDADSVGGKGAYVERAPSPPSAERQKIGEVDGLR